MSKSFKVVATLIILFVIGVLACLGFLFVKMNKLSKERVVDIPPIQQVEEVSDEPKEEIKEPNDGSFSVVEGGLNSWQEVLVYIKDNPEFLVFLTKVTGVVEEEVKILAESEAKGCNYQVTLLKGTCVINTGKKDGEYFSKETSLDKDRRALLGPKGIPVILISCGNPMVPKETSQQSVQQEVPLIRTDNVLSVDVNSAQLAGFIDSKGVAITSWFEWGKGDSLSQKTDQFSQTGQVSRLLTNLEAGTTYSFRLVGKTNQGTFYGEKRILKTNDAIPLPEVEIVKPTARTDSASKIEATSAYLNGMIDTKGETLRSWFEWGTSSMDLKFKIGEISTSGSKILGTDITGLNQGMTYYFRIAVDKGGEVFHGAVRSFTTLSTPKKEEDLLLVRTDNVPSVTRNSAQLAGFTGYEGVVTYFEYGLGNKLNMKTAESIESGNIKKTVSGLSSGTRYSFRLVVKKDSNLYYGETRTFLTDN